jgi:hypothetical protein
MLCESALFTSFSQLSPKVFNLSLLSFGLSVVFSLVFFYFSTNEIKILSFSRPSFLSSITSVRRLLSAMVQLSSSVFFCALKALLRIKPCKKKKELSMPMKYFVSNFKVNFYTFILLYARLSARLSFDKIERPSSSFGNPILLAISWQTNISLLFGRHYKKSSSLVSLNTKAPFRYFNFRA